MHTNLVDSDEKTHGHGHTDTHTHQYWLFMQCDAKRSSMEQDVKMVKRKF